LQLHQGFSASSIQHPAFNIQDTIGFRRSGCSE
jgi:hypothetical protein